MATKKNDSLCFDIGTLNQDQKKEFAKSLKATVDSFNEKVSEPKDQEESE